MKKSLLSLAAVVVALGANAQAEEVFIDADALDLEAVALGGETIAESDNVVLSLPYADTYKTAALAGSSDPYNYIAVNGIEYKAVTGLTGNTNPTNPTINEAASGGCVFQFDVKKDGYLVVFCKFTTNKNYYVWEGLYGESPSAVAYTLGMNYNDEKIVFSMPADADGYIDVTAADIDRYVNTASGTTQKVISIYTNGEDTATSTNGLGVLVFPVYADAEHYLVSAQGSKVSCDGGVFVTEEPTQIALVGAETGVKDLIGTYNSGVSNISVDKVYDENAPVYNVMGQRVAKDTKGILIQNGRKFINK
jgi:hypothetical protein